ncbi:uncharacterized protein NEMAJ01_0420 [Nematocida major]|uniref:uncharacterized protein n=1 Tax=Nematocida major TaxID=1912982 RepID=UPI0020089140|nr:uncharacterized protein NEMAJ01_0420 [Nematocida major]KAH9385524.1 hypothetical protein NEMAJ01_0420 [Nematocida major]
MKRSLAAYIKSNVLWIGLAVAIKPFSLCEMLSKYSYYDVEEAQEYFSGNPLADKPFFLVYALHRAISLVSKNPPAVFRIMSLVCDFISSYFLGNIWYFVLSALFPSDPSSLVCLLFSMYYSGALAKHLAPLLMLVCVESTHTVTTPGLNAYWYVNIQMIEQYRPMFHELFFSTHIFLLGMSTLSSLPSSKLYMAMVFKDLGYRGYLLLWCMLTRGQPRDKILGACLGVALLGFFLDCIVWYMLVFCGVGNMNFLCWSNLITIISTGLATLHHEIKKRRGMQKPAAHRHK